MQRISDTVSRKFIDVVELDEWEIETPSGWQPVARIMKTVKYRRWHLVLENGYMLDAADKHIVMSRGREVFVEDIEPGDVVDTDVGASRVISCVNTGIDEHMFDIEVDDDDHLFYSNGIVSHNTTVAAGYILHELIFNKSFTVAILANKGAQAREIMERVQMMYEELPFFLQPGVKSWNKGSISLGNKSRAFTAATSSSSVRGKSINLLYMDEFAHIENDTEFYQSTYPVIMSGKTTKVIITSTPNGMNLFYKIWTEAKDGRSQYKALQIYWNEHPNRDEAWLREQESNMPPKQIAQEIHCVVGDTPVTVRCVISGSVFDTTMQALYEKQYERQGVIYRVTRADGLSYIGNTLDYKKRMRDHAKTARFANGIASHEILFTGPYSECERLEEFFIDMYDTWKSGLNVTNDGKGKNPNTRFNTFGMPCLPETREKISSANKGRRSGLPGPKHSDEQKKKWSRMRSGRVWGRQVLTESVVREIASAFDSFSPSVEEIAEKLAPRYRAAFIAGMVSVEECRLTTGLPYSPRRHFANTICEAYGVTPNAIMKKVFGGSHVS